MSLQSLKSMAYKPEVLTFLLRGAANQGVLRSEM